jgi:uncharacterized protein (TIGR03437 family)
MRLVSVAVLSLAVSGCAFGQSYTISTFAGGGLPVNIPGTSATLGNPYGVAVDGAGNLFFSDGLNVVLRLDATTGILTLVAGNGTPGFSGDNGPATSAQLYDPTGIALDGAGNLYIADTWNNRIRKVSNGVITTVAGSGIEGFSGDNGPATSAQLYLPYGIAVDAAGNLYIADTGDNRVRKVSNGVITTVAGSGPTGLHNGGYGGDNGPATSAQLYDPQGVAVDTAGNLYIADSYNGRIRKVSNGVITTVAGGGVCSYSCPIGDNIPATSALLSEPSGVAVDSAGNLYIADGYRIRKVSNGVITTVAGNGTQGYSGDNGPATSAQLYVAQGVAADLAGNLYIADTLNDRIRKVSNGVITTVAGNGTCCSSGDDGPATSAELSNPQGVALDSAGNLYIADGQRVRKVSNGVIITVAGNGTGGYSGDNGAATSAQLNGPYGVAVDAAGNLYIADTTNSRISKVSNGVITTVAGTGVCGVPGDNGDNGPATSAPLCYPYGVAVDTAGNLYIADGNRISKVSNGIITTVAGNGTEGYSGDNGPATSAELNNPTGVAVDSAGNLYIADSFNQRIRKVSNGVITTVAGSGSTAPFSGGYSGDNGPATSAQLYLPYGIAVDAAGSLYIADSQNFRVREVSNGVITTVAGNGTSGYGGDNGPAASAQLAYPQGVAVDSAGDVYVADTVNDRIRVLIPSGPACSASVTPLATSAAASGGNLTVAVQTSSSCAWAIQALPDWITFSGSAIGQGPAPVTLTVAANSGGPRTATVSIAGVSVAVTQQSAFLSIAAVTNAASNLAGAISPGEIVALYGSGIGPAQLVSAVPGSNGLYVTQLANTSVSFNGIPAPMIYTWATQVAAIVPYEITGTTAQVTVTYQGQTSAAVSVPIASSAPGIFTLDSTGQGQAAAINQDGVTVNGAATPAKVGDIISLYATGEGQTTPAGVDGKPASVPYPKPNLLVTATVGGQNATVIYAGGAPELVAGLMQVNVQIPAGFQAGSAVPVALQVGDALSPGGVTIAVADPAAPTLTQLSPAHAPAGSSPVTLVVTGSNFQDNVVCPALCGFACPLRSVISFDQTDISTQFVSPAQVQGVVPASLLATARSVNVMVTNPVVVQCERTDNHLSNGLSFTVGP